MSEANNQFIAKLYQNSQTILSGFQSALANQKTAFIKISTKCVLSCEVVSIPIRHYQLSKIDCLFDQSALMEWLSSKQRSNQNQNLKCPGCGTNIREGDFGLDLFLFQGLKAIESFHPPGGDKKKYFKEGLQVRLNQGLLELYQYIKGNEEDRRRVTGMTAIKIQKKFSADQSSQLILNSSISNGRYQKSIADQLLNTILKLQRLYVLLIQRKIRPKSDKGPISQDHMVQLIRTAFRALEPRKEAIKNILIDNCKIVKLGSESLGMDFVYGIKTIRREPSQTYLAVYYPHLGLWCDFELFLDGKPYKPSVLPLSIKDYISDPDNNYIYWIGGKTEANKQTDAFLKVTFPKLFSHTSSEQRKIDIQRLPKFPKEGYQFVGAKVHNLIFVFYGQIRFVDAQECINDELMNNAYYYNLDQEKGTWTPLENVSRELLPRFDGSMLKFYFEPKASYFFQFFGGLPAKPDGLIQHACLPQTKGQIFDSNVKQLLPRSFDTIIDPNPDYNKPEPRDGFYWKKVLNTHLFVIPYFEYKRLILQGEFMRFEKINQPEVYIIDAKSGKVQKSEIHSFEPPTWSLVSYKKQVQRGQEMFQPIYDIEGLALYGNYYTVHQYEDERQQTHMQVLKYHLTNGACETIQFKKFEESFETLKKQLNAMPHRANKIISLR